VTLRDGFREVTIEELCSRVTTGATPLRSRADYFEPGTIDWYKTGELKDWYLAPAEERITAKAVQETSVKIFPPDTILMAMYGDGRTITSLGILRNAAATNQACCAMLVDEKKCDKRYFFYALKHRRNLLLKVASGGAQRNLSGKLIKEFKLPVPPIYLQERIAGTLSAYDELIESNQRRIRILERMARLVYQEWFVEFRFPGHEKVRRVSSALGEIPEGWAVKTVADSFEISGGGTPSRQNVSYWDTGTIQWFSPSHLTAVDTMFMDDSPEHITELGLAESSARLFAPYSVMLTSRATIGAIAINTHEACTNQGFITCIPNDRVPLYFLFNWVRDSVPQFLRLASGATFKEISRGVFKSIYFLLPEHRVVRRFESYVEPIGQQMLALQRQIRNLRSTRDLLLPRLLSGQLDLKLN
jgi:type I restriction enzyme S subunit